MDAITLNFKYFRKLLIIQVIFEINTKIKMVGKNIKKK